MSRARTARSAGTASGVVLIKDFKRGDVTAMRMAVCRLVLVPKPNIGIGKCPKD